MIEVAVVNDEGVELIARLEATHPAKETACRLRGHPEHVSHGEERPLMVLLVVHLAHLYRRDHHMEDADVVASADITAKTYA